MSNFNPNKNVLEKWTSTRKAKKSVGHDFSHPRLFSTVGYQNDKLMFGIAITIELLTLFIAIFFSGFNPFLIFGAAALFGLDLWFARILHNNQSDINKFKCVLELSIYEERVSLKDSRTLSGIQKSCDSSISIYEAKKVPVIIALFIIAAAKAFFGFLILAPYGMAIGIGVPAFFFIAAYIHVKNTGYFFKENKRIKLYNEQYSIFLADTAEGRKSSYGNYNATDVPFEGIKENTSLLNELDAAYNSLSADEKNKRRVNIENKQDLNSKTVILYGHEYDSIHKIVYDESTGLYYFRRWGNVTDDDLFQLIEGARMSTNLKSFIGYQGLTNQYISSSIEKAKVPTKKIKQTN